MPNLKCRMCGAVMEDVNTNRQFCDKCREERTRKYKREYKREQAKRQKQGLAPLPLECWCEMCGKKIETVGRKRRFCDGCRKIRADEQVKKFQEKQRNKREIIPESERPRPKTSLAEANAEARRLGLTYGQWSASKRG